MNFEASSTSRALQVADATILGSSIDAMLFALMLSREGITVDLLGCATNRFDLFWGSGQVFDRETMVILQTLLGGSFEELGEPIPSIEWISQTLPEEQTRLDLTDQLELWFPRLDRLERQLEDAISKDPMIRMTRDLPAYQHPIIEGSTLRWSKGIPGTIERSERFRSLYVTDYRTYRDRSSPFESSNNEIKDETIMYHLLEEIEHPTILSLRLLVADSQAIPIMNLTNGPLRILALTNSMILSERDTAMLKIQTKLEVKKHFQSIFVTERRSTLDLRRFAKQLTIEGITELGVGLAGFAEAQGFVLLRLANAIKELVFFARTHHLYASGAHQLQLRTYEESPFRAQLRVQDAYVALLRGPNSAQISALLTELLQTCPNALFEMSEQLIETIHRFDQLHETHFEVQLLSAFL